MFETIVVFVFGAFAYGFIILIPYIDSVSILLKITKFFSFKEPRGYRDNQKVRQSLQYKNHTRKWVKRKLFLLGIYFVLFINTNPAIKSAWLSMVISFVSIIIVMAIQSNKEHIELRKIRDELI